MSLVEENKESEKQHYQTKNSFQLELLEAVRRRQRQLLGPDDDVDTNTQRHSKELDAKMAKFLSNKQYSLDDSERESSSYQGETARTMDPSSSTSVVNNTRTTTRARVDGVKWEPSITLESDDEVDEYISSDEDDDDDDIVIGSNVRLPNKTTSFGNNTEVPIKTRGLHEASGETGLGLGGKNSSNDKREIDSYERRQSKEDNENTELESKVSVERPSIQRRKHSAKEEFQIETKNSSPFANLKENQKDVEEDNLSRAVSLERPAYGRRREIGSLADSSDDVILKSRTNLEGVDSLSQMKGSKYDDAALRSRANVEEVDSPLQMKSSGYDDASLRSRTNLEGADSSLHMKSSKYDDVSLRSRTNFEDVDSPLQMKSSRYDDASLRSIANSEGTNSSLQMKGSKYDDASLRSIINSEGAKSSLQMKGSKYDDASLRSIRNSEGAKSSLQMEGSKYDNASLRSITNSEGAKSSLQMEGSKYDNASLRSRTYLEEVDSSMQMKGHADDSATLKNRTNLEEGNSSSHMTNSIDDIFEHSRTRMQNSLKNDEGNLRQIGNKKLNGSASRHDKPVELDSILDGQSHKMPFESGRESPAGVLKSGNRKSLSGDDRTHIAGKHRKSLSGGDQAQIIGKHRKSLSGGDETHVIGRHGSDRLKSRSSSGKSTPDAEKGRPTTGRSSPSDGALSSASRKLMQAESRIPSDDSQNDLLSQSRSDYLSKEKKERPRSGKALGDSINRRESRDRESERRPSLKGSKKEVIRREDSWRNRRSGSSEIADSPRRASTDRKRSNSIGNSPREMEDRTKASTPSGKFVSREQSKSDAMNLDNKKSSSKSDGIERERSFNEADVNSRLGSKYSIKRPGMSPSQHKNDVDVDSGDDEETIGIRKSSRTLLKENDHVKPSTVNVDDDNKGAPTMKKALGTELQGVERLRSKDNAVHGKSHEAASSTTARDSLSKFKVKGHNESLYSQTTPVRPTRDIIATQGSSGMGEKGRRSSTPGKVHKTATKRSLSYTNISNIKPKSPYQEIDGGAEASGNTIVDSETLREQIYYDWLKEKSAKTKDEIKELRRREKEKEEDAEKEKEVKKVMSLKAFEAWSASKNEMLKDKRSEIKEKKLKEKEKQDEEQQKKLDSQKHFESWKSNKERELIEQRRKKKEEDRAKQRKEFDDQEVKRSSSRIVYERWKSKKDELLKEKAQERKGQQKEERLKEIEKMERKRTAEKFFQKWKDSKDKSPRETLVLTQRAWCPSGRNSQSIIPESVQPVVQRNPPARARTLSVTARLPSKTMSSTFHGT